MAGKLIDEAAASALTTGTERGLDLVVLPELAICRETGPSGTGRKTLQEGRVLRERFGNRVGGDHSSREDTGVFWSNDPKVSLGQMNRCG